MAKRGRPPKSSAESKKHYTKEELAKKKEVEDKIRDSKKPLKIKVPEFLVDKVDIKTFKEIAKSMADLGIFTEQNLYQLGVYIRNLRRLEQLNKILEDTGMKIEKFDKFGNTWVEPSPFLKAIDTLENRIMKQESVLGISIADRLKYVSLLAESSEEEKDDFEELVSKEEVKEIKELDEEVLNSLKDFIGKVEDNI